MNELEALLNRLHSVLRLEQEMISRGWRSDAAHFSRRAREIQNALKRLLAKTT